MIEHYETVKCPVCKRNVHITDTVFVTHGPGKNDLFCKGSGAKVLDHTRKHRDGAPCNMPKEQNCSDCEEKKDCL